MFPANVARHFVEVSDHRWFLEPAAYLWTDDQIEVGLFSWLFDRGNPIELRHIGQADRFRIHHFLGSAVILYFCGGVLRYSRPPTLWTHRFYAGWRIAPLSFWLLGFDWLVVDSVAPWRADTSPIVSNQEAHHFVTLSNFTTRRHYKLLGAAGHPATLLFGPAGKCHTVKTHPCSPALSSTFDSILTEPTLKMWRYSPPFVAIPVTALPCLSYIAPSWLTSCFRRFFPPRITAYLRLSL